MAQASMTAAVVELWNAVNPGCSLSLDEVPEDNGPSFTPTAYLAHGGEIPEYATGNNGRPNYGDSGTPGPNQVVGRFTIAIFASAPGTAVDAMATIVKNGFKPKSLAMTLGQEAYLFRSAYRLSGTKFRDKADQAVYRADLDYVCTIGNPTG